MLKFLGKGSGFADEHTSAYFVSDDNELVLIDCPMSAFHKLKKKPLSEYKKIYVLITHTHGDHIGGLGLFAQYAYFTAKKHIIIVAPSAEVKRDIETVLQIEGNDISWYYLIVASALKEKDWFGDAILTEHSPQLKNKCFGYQLYVNDYNCIYTGDTSTLEPFIPYMADLDRSSTLFYVDTSVNYGMIHLKLEDTLPIFKKDLNESYIKIFLMHLDVPDQVVYEVLDKHKMLNSNIAIVDVEE